VKERGGGRGNERKTERKRLKGCGDGIPRRLCRPSGEGKKYGGARQAEGL